MKGLKEKSKYLSYLLRHNPQEVNCDIDKYGWVDVDTLCKNSEFTRDLLDLIVSNDTRYEFNSDFSKIRAFHGHSVEGVVPHEECVPPVKIYHGTSKKNLESIQSDGFIRKMSRNFVHSSYDLDKAKMVGSRHGKPVVLVIDAIRAYGDGVKFYESGDNVVLSDDLDYKYVMEIIQ